MVEEESTPLQPASGSQKLRVLSLSTCFLILFSSYNLSLSFTTTLQHDSGFVALALNYISFAIGSFVAPLLVFLLGLKKNFILGGTLLVAYVLAINQPNQTLFFIGSCGAGFGAGLVWIAQGTFVALEASVGGTIAYFTSLFFTLFGANLLIGSGAALIILNQGVSPETLLFAMSGVAAVAVLATLFVPLPEGPPKQEAEMQQLGGQEALVKKEPSLSALQTLLNWAVLLRQPQTLALTLHMFLQGTTQSWNFALFSSVVSDEFDISLCFLAYGFFAIIFSYATGVVYDKLGWRIPLSGVFLLTASLIGLLSLAKFALEGSAQLAVFVICGAIGGSADALNNCFVQVTLVGMFRNKDTLSNVYGLYNTIFCAGYAVSSGLASFLDFHWMVLYHSAVMLCAVTSHAYLKSSLLPRIRQSARDLLAQASGSQLVPTPAPAVEEEAAASSNV